MVNGTKLNLIEKILLTNLYFGRWSYFISVKVILVLRGRSRSISACLQSNIYTFLFPVLHSWHAFVFFSLSIAFELVTLRTFTIKMFTFRIIIFRINKFWNCTYPVSQQTLARPWLHNFHIELFEGVFQLWPEPLFWHWLWYRSQLCDSTEIKLWIWLWNWPNFMTKHKQKQ